MYPKSCLMTTWNHQDFLWVFCALTVFGCFQTGYLGGGLSLESSMLLQNRICSFFGISHEENVQVLEKETRLCIFWSTIFDWSQSESKKIKQFLHTFMSSASARTTVNQPDSCCPSGIMDILPYNYCEMAFGYPLFAKKSTQHGEFLQNVNVGKTCYSSL